jgi:hypothetical protein
MIRTLIVMAAVICMAMPCIAEELNVAEESMIHGISDAVVSGCRTDDETVRALMKFVREKISPKEGVNPYERMSTMKRIQSGTGWCNHQAVVFMHLAYYQGIRTRLLYLKADDGVTSPHTIAEYFDGLRWVIVDPMFGLTGISREDIKKDMNILKRMDSFKGRADEWLRCFINEPEVVFEYNPK